MRIVIVEDEKPAADRLELLLKRYDPDIQVIQRLDPELFFRLNRTYVVNINAIRDVIIHSNSRLKVLLEQQFEKELIVSREKVSSFKMWFGMRE